MKPSLLAVVVLNVPKGPDEIAAFTQKALQLLADYKELDIYLERRIKLILIELITNSIKHSLDSEGIIKLTIHHSNLTIQKIDKGSCLEFTNQSLPFEETGKTIKVCFSEQNGHQIKTLDKYKFKFINSFTEDLSLDQLPEKFGFYIITLASDDFIYQYDPDLSENNFMVLLNL